MKTEKIQDMLQYLDPELIEEADLPGSRKRMGWGRRFVLVAACLCLAALCVAAGRYGKVWLDWLTQGKGYHLTSQMTPWQIADLGEELREYYEGVNPWDIYPEHDEVTGLTHYGAFVKSFPDMESAREYVGIPLRDSSLLFHGAEGPVVMEADSSVVLSGNSVVDGKISIGWNIVIQLDLYGGNTSDGGLTGQSLSSEEYEMANGETAIIVEETTQYSAGEWHAVYAWFVADGIRWRLSFGDGGSEEQYLRGREVMYQVLDSIT